MVKRPLTSGALAVSNLRAQIDGLERQTTVRSRSVRDRVDFIELVALRGQILGRIADVEFVEECTEQLTRDAPDDSASFLARARARGRFHRFSDALTDLDEAERLGADPAIIGFERASVFQAVGRYEASLTIYNDAAKSGADFNLLGALATLHAERGEIGAAEELFEESCDRYRGISPFPLAFLNFRRGHMWLANCDLQRAFFWFETAVRTLPDYAPAQAHLAQVEAARGELDAAIVRLLPLVSSSDDPAYAASLAHVFLTAGYPADAGRWNRKAAARYDELLARHPEAFADHAAEFWLDGGADPHRALQLARINLKVRRTARARELVARAIEAV